MNALQAAVYSAKAAMESSGITTPNRVWLHTNAEGPCLRVHVDPGKAVEAARHLKDLSHIVPIWIEERENSSQGETA